MSDSGVGVIAAATLISGVISYRKGSLRVADGGPSSVLAISGYSVENGRPVIGPVEISVFATIHFSHVLMPTVLPAVPQPLGFFRVTSISKREQNIIKVSGAGASERCNTCTCISGEK